MKAQNYKTQYEIVYSNNRRNILTAEQFGELGFPEGYEAAAIKVVYHNDKISSRDEMINNDAWANADIKGYHELAIEKRKSLD